MKRRLAAFIALWGISACGAPAPVSSSGSALSLNNGRWVSQRHTSASYAAAHLVYDSTRDRVVMVARDLGQAATNMAFTYEWDVDRWTQQPAAPVNIDPADALVTYDPTRQRVVLYIGRSQGTHPGTPQTFTYDGSEWSQMLVASPPRRNAASMTYDPVSDRVLLYGGLGDYQFNPNPYQPGLSDMWSWNGAAWTELFPSTTPGPRTLHGMTFDSARNRVVLFGGWPQNPLFSFPPMDSAIWEWSGTTWEQAETTSAATFGDTITPSLHYDAHLQRLLRPSIRVLDGTEWLTPPLDGTIPSFSDFRGMVYVPTMAAYMTPALRIFFRGNDCTLGSECHSGNCVDGACCDQTTCGTCARCDGNIRGLCSPITTGVDPDTCSGANVCGPRAFCGLPDGSSCGADGDCASRFCTDGICCNARCNDGCNACDALTRAWPGATNDGICTIAPAGEHPACSPFTCDGVSPFCGSNCDVDADCVATHFCGADHFCKERRAIGETCDPTNECTTTDCEICQSGHCADGVCCATDCSAGCMACNLPSQMGTCALVAPGGPDVHGVCAVTSATTCGTDGTCDGAGMCRLYTAGTLCAALACSDSSTVAGARTCDGTGACLSAPTTSCGAYACSSGTCLSSCAGQADCAPGYACVAGTCQLGCPTACGDDNGCCAGQRCIAGACATGGVPLFSSTPSLTATVNEVYHYDADDTASASPGPVTFALTSTPAGAAIDPVSGRVFFQPTIVAPTEINITATNPWGATTQHFIVDVTSDGAPSIARDANPEALVAVAYTLNGQGTLNVAGKRPMSFRVAQGPSELHIQSDGRVDWTPARAGLENITIIASNSLGSDSYSFSVDVRAAPGQGLPIPAIEVFPAAQGNAPLDVELRADGSRASGNGTIRQVLWTFGDGSQPAFETIVQHRYRAGGWTARLLVLDNLGQSAETTQTIRAGQDGALPPTARILTDRNDGAAPSTIAFRCDCVVGPNARLNWTFGDGESSAELAPTHIYNRAGSYTARLVVEDIAANVHASDQVVISIRQGDKQPPRALAFSDLTSGDVNLTVQLGALVSDPDGQVVRTEWSLDGAVFSTDTQTSKTFLTAGRYLVTFRAVDNDGLEAFSFVEIDATNQGKTLPVILSRASTRAFAGTPFRYSDDGQPTVRGDRPLRFSLKDPDEPAGIAIDPNTGAISWTPSDNQTGEHPVTLVVENDAGSTFEAFVIVVEPRTKRSGCAYVVSASATSASSATALFAFLILAALRVVARRRA